MATADTNATNSSSPMFWKHLWGWIQAIPRAAILSLIGPSILLLVGYLGWRHYGAKALDSTFYALKQENIHLTNSPPWLKTNVVEEVYQGSGLNRMSLLDDQTAAVVARAFDTHPWIRRTYRVQKMAGGQMMVNVEFREPVAMVHCQTDPDETSGMPTSESFLPVDGEGVLLPTKDFSQGDIANYILVYAKNIRASDHRRVGTPLGDSQIGEAIQLCRLLAPIRNEANILSVYVYPARRLGKGKWSLEIATKGGPRILWGSAPGLEGLDEPTSHLKMKRLLEIVSQRELWTQPEFDLSDSVSMEPPPATGAPRLSRRL